MDLMTKHRKKTVAEIGLELLSGEPPFLCADCGKGKAWFDPRFNNAICDACWKTGNYSDRIKMSIGSEKAQKDLE